MKSLYIATILFFLIIALVLANCFVLSNRFNHLKKLSDGFENSQKHFNNESNLKKIEKSDAFLKKYKELFVLTVDHEKIGDCETSLKKVKDFATNDRFADYMAALLDYQESLDNLSRETKLNWRYIF